MTSTQAKVTGILLTIRSAGQRFGLHRHFGRGLLRPAAQTTTTCNRPPLDYVCSFKRYFIGCSFLSVSFIADKRTTLYRQKIEEAYSSSKVVSNLFCDAGPIFLSGQNYIEIPLYIVTNGVSLPPSSSVIPFAFCLE